jgi:N-6 DNA Methylase
MAEMYTTRALLSTMREGLLDIGYREDLLQENYGFTDMFAQDQAYRSVEIGVFAQNPPSYRNACFGVVVPPSQGSEAILQYRALGAPQIFALHPESKEIFCWKILAQDSPQLIDKIEVSHLRNAIYAHRTEWNPESILRAKSIRFTNEPVQLDFFDLGLVPELEGIVYQKLDRLLNDVIASCEAVYNEHHEGGLDYKALFRLIFRLIAAKLLGDRQYPGRWLSADVQEVIKAVENFYFQHTAPEAILDDTFVQETAWRQIRTAFSFRNLSVEALAYVYENTLVTPETRKYLATHATPPEIAEYIVQNLPLQELHYADAHIFEPFCGHAPFLTAALSRLRTLPPFDTMPVEQRHAYFIHMLSGIEIDSFACEVARNSLILADYPNPNGWDIANSNFFTGNDLDKHLTRADVVFCNPPYEDFSQKDRQANHSIGSANKAVEVLRRILQIPPAMLGVVLPRVFMNGQSYRHIKSQLNTLYNNITLVELPPIFNFAEVETVLLIAHGKRTAKPVWRSVIVEKKDYQQFVYTGRPTIQTEIPSDFVRSENGMLLWYSHLQRIWNELTPLPKLGSIAEIRTGMQYNISIRENENILFSDTPRNGFAKGLRRVTDDFEPYVTRASTYLNMDPQLMLYEAYKLPWDRPKVIANAARLSRGRWLIAGAIDEQGLVCIHNFHSIWPKGSVPLEVLAALLNSPITNAFLSVHRTSRHNQIRILQQVPIPNFTQSQLRLIVSLVREYMAIREQWRHQPDNSRYLESSARGIMRQIDAELLRAYNLPIELERELVNYFAGYKRPGPIPLKDIKPSPEKRFYTSIIRIEGVRNEGDDKVVDAVVISWNPHQIVHFPISFIPQHLQDKLTPDVRLLARVNIGAETAEDLVFEETAIC